MNFSNSSGVVTPKLRNRIPPYVANSDCSSSRLSPTHRARSKFGSAETYTRGSEDSGCKKSALTTGVVMTAAAPPSELIEECGAERCALNSDMKPPCLLVMVVVVHATQATCSSAPHDLGRNESITSPTPCST